jgi:hypothetical protein
LEFAYVRDVHVSRSAHKTVVGAQIPRWLLAAWMGLGFVFSGTSFAQASPELAMREFASGQVKKGVRSIGFGGDGATWGNYALVWKDAGGALVDYADTRFTNRNDFHFSAVGITSPSLWHDLAIYVIALDEGTNVVHFTLKAPGIGPGGIPVIGTGSDHALFSKIALPLGRGFSAGVLLSYETSAFDTAADANPTNTVHYETKWRPSGGFGVAWQPDPRILVGVRALLNTDHERRTDPAGAHDGTARSQEYRVGISVSPWVGALVDVGGTRLQKENSLAASHTVHTQPNLGFEQGLFDRRLTFRFGRDETSLTAGLSSKFAPFDFGLAYVNNMAHARVGNLFGENSSTLMLTVGVDYGSFARKP